MIDGQLARMRDPPGDSAEPLRREDDCRGAAVGPMEGSVFPSWVPTTAIAGACLSVKGGSIAKAGVLVAIRFNCNHPGLRLGRFASPSFH
jgi:hypothetical protein